MGCGREEGRRKGGRSEGEREKRKEGREGEERGREGGREVGRESGKEVVARSQAQALTSQLLEGRDLLASNQTGIDMQLNIFGCC